MDVSNGVIQQCIKALKDDAAGNAPATMTDIDLAVKLLEKLLSINDEIAYLKECQDWCDQYR